MPITFRRRLSLLAVAPAVLVASALSACSGSPRTSADSVPGAPAHLDPAHWDYDAEGPDHWADLDHDFLACQQGHRQSPIDLAGRIRLSPREHITVEYGSAPSVQVLNTGHTVQAQLPAGNANRILVDGVAFELAQLHFHLPSEHTVDGAGTAMELHLVHKNAEGRIAVLAVFLREQPERSPVDAIIAAAPPRSDAPAAPLSGGLDLRALLPADPDQFRYEGSLTTPPCSEGVLWTVLRTPMGVATATADRYRELFPHSNRPTQPLYERTVTLAGK